MTKNLAQEPPGDVAAFAERLTQARLDAGLSIRALSRSTGLHAATLGGYFSGRHLPPANRPDVLENILRALGIEKQDQRMWRDWLQSLHRHRRTGRAKRAPYRGLEHYREADHDVFFGRDDSIRELLEQTERTLTTSPAPLLAIVGPSGSGKSSVVRAGLIPRLTTQGWSARVIQPGTDPLGTLDAAMTDQQSRSDAPAREVLVVDQLEEIFTQTTEAGVRRTFLDGLTQWARPTGDEDSETAADPRRLTIVVLRSDHYGNAILHEGLRHALQHHQFLLGPMTEDELRRAVEGPARAVGLGLEPGLVDVLLADAAGDVSALPHASHVLASMWDHSDRRTLTVADYRNAGGLHGSIVRTAEAAFQSLTPDQRHTGRTLLLRMVTVGEDLTASRRHPTLAELREVAGDTDVVLDALATQRLISLSEDQVGLSHEVLISAWPQLSDWIDQSRTTLVLQDLVTRESTTWDDAGREPSLLLRGSRLAAVQEWCSTEGPPLTSIEQEFVTASTAAEEAAAHQQASQHRRTRQLLAVAATLAVFTCVASVLAYLAWGQAVRERDDAQSRQIAAVAAEMREADIPLSQQLAVAAYQTSTTREARSALLDATTSPTVFRWVDDIQPRGAAATPDGSLLSLGGTDGTIRILRPLEGTWSELSHLALTPDHDTSAPPTIAALSYGADQQVLAAIGQFSGVRLIDLARPESPTELDALPGDHAGTALVFDTAGSGLFVGTDAGSVLRWTASDGGWEQHTALSGLEGSVEGLSVSSDSRWLAATTSTGDIGVWDLNDTPVTPGASLRIGDGSLAAWDVAISPDGRWVVTGSRDGTVRVISNSAGGPAVDSASTRQEEIDREALEVIETRTAFGSWATSVAFSADGTMVVAGSSDSTVYAWSFADGRLGDLPVVSLPTRGGVIAVHPVGADAWAITTEGEVAYIWDQRGPALAPATATVFQTYFSTHGNRMLHTSGSLDGGLYLYDANDPHAPALASVLRAPEGSGQFGGGGTISPDGMLAVGGTRTGHLVAWDVSDAYSPALLFDEPIAGAMPQFMVVTDDGDRLTAVSDDGHLRVIGLVGDLVGQVIADSGPRQPMHTMALHDDRLIGTGDTAGGIQLWDIEDLSAPLAEIVGDRITFGIDFAPDGQTMITSGSDGLVHFYDISDPRDPQPLGTPLSGPVGETYSAKFDPTGNRLAAAATDGRVWVWEQREVGTWEASAALSADTRGWRDLDWSPDGRVIVAGGYGGETRLWMTDTAEARAYLCTSSGAPVSAVEWSGRLPGVDYAPPCG